MSKARDSPLNVGIVGAGIGGLTAAIAIAQAGARVTVLEATKEIGEIGAGIQMFGNVSRFLIRTGVDEIIGENLVRVKEVRTWGYSDRKEENGRLIGRADVDRIVKMQGFPWWVVRRDHLHDGLARGARRNDVKIITDFRVSALESHGSGAGATVTSVKGDSYQFDLIVGADGIRSVTRNLVFPEIQPHSASNIAAYRTIIPYEEVYKHVPEARVRLGNTMDTWVGPGGYILLYPLAAGKELNIVTAYVQSRPVTQLEEVSVTEFRAHYNGWDPFILKILELVKETKRWPLNIIPPTKRWSNEEKTVALMGEWTSSPFVLANHVLGDAAHGMQNHIAQGAATAMEDGIFLGRILGEVVRGVVDLDTAVHLYEKKRIPRAFHKQQAAFTQGETVSVQGKEMLARDGNMEPEVKAWDVNAVRPNLLPATYRSWLLYVNPQTIPSILYYDAESDADFAVDEWLMNHNDIDPKTHVSHGLRKKWWRTVEDNGLQIWERAHPTQPKL